MFANSVQDDDANAYLKDDDHALFNPKLEFYNISRLHDYEFHRNFFDEEEKWLIKISTHAD